MQKPLPSPKKGVRPGPVLLHKHLKKHMNGNCRLIFHNKFDTFTQIPTREPYGLSISDKVAYLQSIVDGNSDQLDTDKAEDSDVEFEAKAHRRALKKRDQIDVQDTDHDWLHAEVMLVREHFVYITYIGYDAKWNEWIDMYSPRIAPSGTFCCFEQRPRLSHQSELMSSDPDDDSDEGSKEEAVSPTTDRIDVDSVD